MPSAKTISSIIAHSGPHFRSRRRISKLVGKQNEESSVRKRISSEDFESLDEFSSLKTMKNSKKTHLNELKNDGMQLMFA